MSALSQIWDQIRKALNFQKVFWGIAVLAFIFIFWASFFRACSSHSNQNMYRIAKDITWFPLQLYGQESNISAFSNDLIFSIARSENLSIELVSTSYQRLFELLDSKSVDGVLSTLNPDLTQQDSYLFSDPYYLLGAVLVIPKDSTVKSLKDLAGKTIAVKRGSSVLFHLPLAPSSIVIPYDSPTLTLDDLVRGNIDAVVMDQFTAHFFLSEFFRTKLKVANLPMTVEGLRLVTRNEPSGKILIDKFNAGLKLLKENGTFDLLLDKWDLYNPESVGSQKIPTIPLAKARI